MTTYSNAQHEWKSGYVVRSTSDTLRGEILFKDWDISPDTVKFRSRDNTGLLTFSAEEISGFGISEPRTEYESKLVTIKYYTKDAININANPVVGQFTRTVFLEALMRSQRLTFYSFYDQNKDERFFIEKDNHLTELVNINISYSVRSDDKTYVFRQPLYRDQLKQVLNECPTLTTSGLSYNSSDILKLLRSYHNYCQLDYRPSFQQKNDRDIFLVGVTGGQMLAANLQILSRKRFNNRFVLAELGRDINDTSVYFGLYAGTYIGVRQVQPCIFTGFSTTGGFLDTGVGVAFKRRAALTLSSGLLFLATGKGEMSSLKFRVSF